MNKEKMRKWHGIVLLFQIVVVIFCFLNSSTSGVTRDFLPLFLVNGLSNLWLGISWFQSTKGKQFPKYINYLFQIIGINALAVLSFRSQYGIFSFILMAYTCQQQVRMMKEVSRYEGLRQDKWRIKCPVGWTLGVNMILFHLSFLTYCQSVGIDITLNWWWITLSLLIGIGLYFYAQFGNESVSIPLLLYLSFIGVDTYYSNGMTWQIGIIWLALSIGIVLYGYFCYLQRKQRKLKAGKDTAKYNKR